jgi:O-methyltransferase
MNLVSKTLRSLARVILNWSNLEIRKIGREELEFPIEATSFHREIISTAKNYSMTSTARMWSLIQAFEHVNKQEIAGDYVECGVWKGGNLILLAALQQQIGTNRTIYGFDTFSGMVEPGASDIDYLGNRAKDLMLNSHKLDGNHNIHAFASIESVRINLDRTRSENIKLVQGDVAKTLADQGNLPEKISILRLDTDWYESTKIELEVLFPLLEPGGVLIIDDYGHFAGAQKAVDEYFHSEKVWLHYVDYTCRLLIKGKVNPL